MIATSTCVSAYIYIQYDSENYCTYLMTMFVFNMVVWRGWGGCRTPVVNKYYCDLHV